MSITYRWMDASIVKRPEVINVILNPKTENVNIDGQIVGLCVVFKAPFDPRGKPFGIFGFRRNIHHHTLQSKALHSFCFDK